MKEILIIIAAITFLIIGYFIGRSRGKKFVQLQIPQERQDAIKRSRGVLGGKFSEKIAPYLPGFPKDLKASEARFIGDPIDFVIFKGMDDKNITEVVFVEVKTGRSHLNTNEKTLKDAIDNKMVRWVPFNISDEIMKNSESEDLSGKSIDQS